MERTCFGTLRQLRGLLSTAVSGWSSIVTIVALVPGLSSCGVSVSEKMKAAMPSDGPDFLRSEIITNSPGVADGTSELLMAIQLMNSDGTVVSLYKPTYHITKGAGVRASECTSSNNNGISVCILKATIPGVKQVSVTNIRMKLEKEVFFEAPSRKNFTGIVSSARYFETSSGYEMSATVGSSFPGPVLTNGSGWKLFGGVEGNAFSR